MHATNRQDLIERLHHLRVQAGELVTDLQMALDDQCQHVQVLHDVESMEAITAANPQQWIDAARLQLQTGFMMAERAIEQPQEF